MSRAAHRFHRFAHHPLCDEYAGEVIRLGRRARVCRGCSYAWGGASAGAMAAFASHVPLGVELVMLALATAFVAFTTLRRRTIHRTKILTRLAPAATMGSAIGAGLRVGGGTGIAFVLLTASILATLSVLYRRRGPDRTPCTTCPERLAATPCRGFTEIVTRERAFRRLASRLLTDP